MKETSTITYSCEICNHIWSVKEFAEKCEAIGYPKHYNQLLGKWIVVPSSVYFSEKKAENSFDFSPRNLWRVVRIDSNYITNLLPDWPIATGTMGMEHTDQLEEYDKEYIERILSLHHRLVVGCKGFEDNSRVESLKQFFDVPEEKFEYLNSKLVEMELVRAQSKESAKKEFGDSMTRYISNFFTSPEFEDMQHKLAEQMLKEVIANLSIGDLPEIHQEEPASITVQVNE